VTERLARADDLATLQAIELAAGVLFREIGMTDVAEHPPPTLQVLEHFRSDGRAWVSVDTDDRPDGFVLVELIDGAAHIETLGLNPADRICMHRPTASPT
jgi:hypothetical protein